MVRKGAGSSRVFVRDGRERMARASGAGASASMVRVKLCRRLVVMCEDNAGGMVRNGGRRGMVMMVVHGGKVVCDWKRKTRAA